jgi:5-(carboxyamino)imidazole ribonucleotide synthase
LFDTGNELLVNEIAPRVHNSAHYSQNALELSQFGFHLLSVMNVRLPKPKLIGEQFLMLNLIGVKSRSQLRAPTITEGILHWYGKNEERIGRKLGHINLISQKKDPSLLKRGFKIRKQIGY